MLTMGEKLMERIRKNGRIHETELTDKEIQKLDNLIKNGKDIDKFEGYYLAITEDPEQKRERMTEEFWNRYWDYLAKHL